ncbi:aldo/keto reductase [Pedobacter alpinus]|uniref:Aldo/keto reductase n=1 Tax=Pedobacter alpinus TaxID=1590643 RepID=A0ABW5TTA8_9SPHI
MRKIELIPGIASSVLGFGCAPILGSINKKTAQYALDFALDNGVNHLDLARSYGYGDAEGFVGNAIKGKRDSLVLASKFGIEANWKASFMKPLKPIAREVKNFIKKNKQQTLTVTNSKNVADRFLDRIVPLRGELMRKSLEKSLKELGTDYLDYFFIHEPFHTVTYIDEINEMANKLKEEGKIRAFGIAYMQTQEHLHQNYLNSFDILQFDKPAELEDYKRLVSTRGTERNILFSPMKGGGNATANEKLKNLLNDFNQSIVLCSMFNLAHVKENIRIAGEDN